jgi:predicted O-methyltransferase YrrM
MTPQPDKILAKLLAEPTTDSTPLYRYRDAISAVDLLAVAIAHLNLFSWLAERRATLDEICQGLAIHRRPADVMMTLLAALGLVQRDGDMFEVSPMGREHLGKQAPWDLTPYFASTKDRLPTLDMLKVLRTGKPANFGSFDPQEWIKAMERPDFAEQFTRAMDCRGVLLGPALAKAVDFSKSTALLDVAGGSGIYACAIVAQHPHMKAAVLDRPPVDRIARECIGRRGAAHKVDVIAADMLTGAWPTGFDAHLLSNVLHDWDEPIVRQILASSAAALPKGGLVIVHDAFINADKTGPLHVAEYSALLMGICEGKCYSTREMKGFFAEAGFEWIAETPTAVARSVAVGRKR